VTKEYQMVKTRKNCKVRESTGENGEGRKEKREWLTGRRKEGKGRKNEVKRFVRLKKKKATKKGIETAGKGGNGGAKGEGRKKVI